MPRAATHRLDLSAISERLTCNSTSSAEGLTVCASQITTTICTALHISWFFPAFHPTIAPYGLGFNPPALVNIYHTPGTHPGHNHAFPA